MNEIFIVVIAALMYSGPLFPLGATLFLRKRSFEHFKRDLRLFALLVSIQALAFSPYILAEIFRHPDALHALILPAALGALLFAGTLVYLTVECRYLFLRDRKKR